MKTRNIVPNLFVAGVPKSGTTTLHGLLDQHPQIYMCSPKEPRFFSRDSEYVKGFDWYLDSYFKGSGSYRIRGEATPTYLCLHKKTIPRIRECLAEQTPKFIAIFRNPIDRAYSHYWFNRNTKFNYQETLSFENALASEDSRMQNSPELYEEGRISYAYFQTGLYGRQIQAFIEEFGRQNCLWLLFEDLLPESFGSTVQVIENFLSIDLLPLKYIKKKESMRFRSNALAFLMRKSRDLRAVISPFLQQRFRSSLKSSILGYNVVPFRYPEMDSATREMLFHKYQPDIAQFEKIIGRDLSHWK